MGAPFVQLDNLYFVPVIRQRLSFALLVRNAFLTLQNMMSWDQRDLIAVAFPNSIAEKLTSATQMRTAGVMPVSLIISTWDNDKHHEVTPVTPADGMIEAVRLALEHNIPLEWIDQEMRPGHLLYRSCLRDPEWPDDDISRHLGVEGYLQSIAHLIQQPPIRFEPIDTWREEHIAEKLRGLGPRFRRVLVVGEATHVEGIRRRLKNFSQQIPVEPEEKTAPTIKTIRPKPEIMLNSLDDFPRIVEVFEKARNAAEEARQKAGSPLMKPLDFEKWEALFLCLQKAMTKGVSMRSLMVFRQFVMDLLGQNQRFSPRMMEVKEACQDCFGARNTEQILTYLGGYYPQINIERIVILPKLNHMTYFVRTDRSPDREAFYLQRFCNPQPVQYSAGPVPYKPPRSAKGDRNLRRIVIGPSPFFTLEMRKKVTSLAAFQKMPARSMPFSGSMKGGVDIRRTVQSHFLGRPALYVKEWSKRKQTANFSKEPIVWLFNLGTQERDQRYLLKCALSSDPYNSSTHYVTWSEAGGSETCIEKSEDGLVEIHERNVFGRLSYHDFDTIARAKAELGEGFSRRIPNHERDHRVIEPLGCVHGHFHENARNGVPWWDLLLLSGIHHADKAVIYVVPEDFRLSNLVRSYAKSRKIELLCFHLSYFNPDQIRKLATGYTAGIPPGSENDNKMRNRLFAMMDKLGIQRGPST